MQNLVNSKVLVWTTEEATVAIWARNRHENMSWIKDLASEIRNNLQVESNYTHHKCVLVSISLDNSRTTLATVLLIAKMRKMET